MWRWLAVGLAFALLLRRLGILAALPWPPPLPHPEPRKPPRQLPPACAIPLLNVQKQPGTITLRNLVGGQHWADVIVVEGLHALTSDLVLVAEDLLKINGHIDMRLPRRPGDPTVSMTLVCRDGDVHIAPPASLALACGAPGQEANAAGMGQGDPGLNGGHITIIGVNILHEGHIVGACGGDGGKADVAPGAVPRFGTRADSAVAVGGCGGYAGDVLLCATETIKLRPDSKILGGSGGPGGNADARSSQYGDAYARGGDSSAAGHIRFEAQGPGACLVLIDAAEVQAGQPAVRAKGNAMAGAALGWRNTTGSGGGATAIAGAGAMGGDVLFSNNCRVDNRGVVRSGDGDEGGKAQAYGGNGRWHAAAGDAGGNASGDGGAGGMAGAKPSFIDMQGQRAFGTQGDHGWGGDGIGLGGDGGTADPGSPGGASGTSEARGGPSGNGNTAIHVQMRAQPANGAAGAAALHAGSAGARP